MKSEGYTKVMPESDYSDSTVSKTLELLTKSLEQHEREIDRIIQVLERVKGSVLSGYGDLNVKLQIVTEKTESIESDVHKLRNLLS